MPSFGFHIKHLCLLPFTESLIVSGLAVKPQGSVSSWPKMSCVYTFDWFVVLYTFHFEMLLNNKDTGLLCISSAVSIMLIILMVFPHIMERTLNFLLKTFAFFFL